MATTKDLGRLSESCCRPSLTNFVSCSVQSELVSYRFCPPCQLAAAAAAAVCASRQLSPVAFSLPALLSLSAVSFRPLYVAVRPRVFSLFRQPSLLPSAPAGRRRPLPAPAPLIFPRPGRHARPPWRALYELLHFATPLWLCPSALQYTIIFV